MTKTQFIEEIDIILTWCRIVVEACGAESFLNFTHMAIGKEVWDLIRIHEQVAG